METVSTHQDYSVRAEKRGDDELGLLTEKFNTMLGQIEINDENFRGAWRTAQQRTTELQTTQAELLEKERALRQAQKLESLGLLAGGIAHEFNNLLTVIGGFARAGLKKVDDAKRVRGCLDEVIAASDRATDLTSQMLSFSRDQVIEDNALSVGKAVEDLQHMLRSLLAEPIDLEIEVDDAEADQSYVKSDSAQLSQAILNLAVNARDAMPEGGKLKIGCHNVQLTGGHRFSHQANEIAPGQYVRLFVSYTGTGIPPEIMDRIFDPLFSTKEAGKGTGLGLSMVFGLAKRLGGFIDVESAIDAGTTFSIYIPKLEGEPPPQGAEIEAESSFAGKGGTILVAEDEAQLRSFVGMTLTEIGYDVLMARNGKEAIELYGDNSKGIDLLVTDVVMPKMGGAELADQLFLDSPNLKVVYMSGYAPKLNVHPKELGKGSHFLRKPFGPEEFGWIVGEALNT
jgi:signal transduction histidine kinase/CheY-like chemotaxis protein